MPTVTSEGEALGSESLGFVFSWDRREGHEGAERTEPNGPGMGIKKWRNESREPLLLRDMGPWAFEARKCDLSVAPGRSLAARILNGGWM